MREAVLLLAEGEYQRFVELPRRPEFGEAIVEWLKVRAADHLRVQRKVLEESDLGADTGATGFVEVGVAIAAVAPMILPVVATKEPEFVDDPIVVVFVDQPEVVE